jgi:cellulose synthase/poly-beta-1,6-N-acetylglucosamine synthase-like glycosyltransferase
LNYALERTSPKAEIIGVIDSDYVVDSNWLRELAPQFARAEIAVVQAPQDYRDVGENAFKAMSYAEYRGFFYIGMVTRNERNAIIQHGTMTLVRRTALQEVGGWSEWCITEDAELGLTIFSHGYEAAYIPKSYGKGLMPDTFLGYKNQRFRWAYGAMQIIRRHFGQLMGIRASKLTAGQRYHFMAGWLPWIADGVNLLFNLAALGWSLAMILEPLRIDPPLIIFSILPLALFTFKIAKVLYLYRGAHIVGTFTRNKPFMRTPKLERASALFKAIAVSREELVLLTALWAAAGTLAYQQYESASLDLLLWVIVLLVQSLPYLAAVIVAIVSAFPRLGAKLVCGGSGEEPVARES